MRCSHICQTCFAELAAVRALPEPRYALPIVVCPGCASVCVRTRHTDTVFWREIRLLAAGIVSVIIRLVLLAAAGLILAMAIFATGYNLTLEGWGDWAVEETQRLTPDDWSAALLLLSMPVLSGLITRLVLTCRGAWRVLLVLLCVMAAWAVSFELATYLFTLDHAAYTVNGASQQLVLAIDAPLVLIFLAGVGLLLARLGIGIGAMSIALTRRCTPGRVRRGLRRARKRRSRRMAGG